MFCYARQSPVLEQPVMSNERLRRLKHLAGLFAVAVVVGTLPSSQVAAQSPQQEVRQPTNTAVRCTRLGQTREVAGRTQDCIRKGGRNIWVTRPSTKSGTGNQTTSSSTTTTIASTQQIVVWMNDGKGGWMTNGKPPPCPTIDWRLPIDDLGLVTAVMDPGQVRGGNYKGHGGFHMTTSDVVVRSPLDGYIVGAAAYLERQMNNPNSPAEIQYIMDIQHPCGFMVRFDHLKELSPEIAKALASLKVREDTQGAMLNPPVPVTRGQVIATKIGHLEYSINRSFDFGAYDVRAVQPNRRTRDQLLAFGPDGQLGMYAICWFDLFGSANASVLRNLPRPSTEAAQGSDICR